MNEATLRILIVADDALARAGLAAVLMNQAGCIVAGQVGADADLAAHVAVYDPDVILWDLGWDPTRMAPGSQRPMLERLAEQTGEDIPIVALVPDAGFAAAAWAAGARALLPREAASSTMAAAIDAAAHGLVTLDASLVPALLTPATQASSTLLEALTPREQQVLHLLAQGLPNKAIARQLTISEHTVKFHVNAILGKLGAQSRTEAVVLATRLGLLSL
jgi:DNA-binding NarL/FixJ family response regulator